MPASPAFRRLIPVFAFGAGVALAVGAGLALRGGDRRDPTAAPAPESSAPPSATPGRAEEPAAEPPRPAAEVPPLAPFGTLELSRADFPATGPVVVRLDLVEPSADEAPRLVRMFSVTDQRGILTEVRLDAARSVGTLEIDPAFLLPGDYFVEVQTTERTAFPARRYAIVVR